MSHDEGASKKGYLYLTHRETQACAEGARRKIKGTRQT